MKQKILIVEDDRTVAELVGEILTVLGYEVVLVTQAFEEVFGRIERENPDLVIIDIVLGHGRLDGIEIARRLKEHHMAPFVFFTGYTEDALLARAKETEPLGYFVKPFKAEEIKVLVETALFKAKAEKERRLIEREITRRLQFEKTVSVISSRFIGINNINESIESSLRDIGTVRQANRAYLFLFNNEGTHMDNTHEWCAEGIASQKEMLRNLPVAMFGWSLKQLATGEAVHIKSPSGIPEEARDEKKLIESRHIKSLLIFPLFIGGVLSGLIGFEGSHHTKEWTDDDVAILRVGSDVIGRAIQFHRAQQELEKHRFHLEELVETRTKELKDSLREKELLLKELHHRVKNNMQVISSLLSLQGRGSSHPEVAVFVQESQNRIRAMALLHEKLYHMESMTRIDPRDYIKELVQSLFRVYFPIGNKITSHIEIEDLALGVSSAIACGLIINELVLNAIKYAFPGDRKGKVTVRLLRREENTLELTVGDDGVGISQPRSIEDPESLGLELVKLIAEEQLEGKVRCETEGGTTFIITFPEAAPAPPPKASAAPGDSSGSEGADENLVARS
ncbi:MAG: histidine kinase dimerization/phosphoacceptor domain -containing protein [Candidatus Eremiobacteraeota bacterium]|nr:histidine kinase dimerization/phosphoacceptor domain -containing protein [Candidatus Eremiobacteraeota bacterium]